MVKARLGLELCEDRTVPTQVVTITALSSATEGGAAGVVRFSRTGDLSGPLTVGYTVSGTAAAGADFSVLSGSVTFAAGATDADVPVTALADNEFEDPEAVTLTLSAAGAESPGGSNSATVYLADVPPQVTATATLPPDGSEGVWVTLTRTGGDPSRPLTTWVDLTRTLQDQGQTLTVTLAATAVFDAGQLVLTLPVVAAPNDGGAADVNVLGATVAESRPDQSVTLTAALTILDEPANPRFGAIVLGLPETIENLPGPISYAEYRALIEIRAKVLAMPAGNFEEPSHPTKILDAIAAKLQLGVDWRSLPNPALPLQAVAGGIGVTAALITGATNWAQVVQRVEALIPSLGDEDFRVREQSSVSIQAIFDGYILQGDLTRAATVFSVLQHAFDTTTDAEIRSRLDALLSHMKAWFQRAPQKQAALAAVAGGWIYGIGGGQR